MNDLCCEFFQKGIRINYVCQEAMQEKRHIGWGAGQPLYKPY